MTDKDPLGKLLIDKESYEKGKAELIRELKRVIEESPPIKEPLRSELQEVLLEDKERIESIASILVEWNANEIPRLDALVLIKEEIEPEFFEVWDDYCDMIDAKLEESE